jgi:Cysteine-rich secretory protein family
VRRDFAENKINDFPKHASFLRLKEPAMPATALEQMILELINRARLDPAAEAARYGIALNEGVSAGATISTDSKQPLAMNETLLGTARTHSQDEIDRDYFSHNTPENVDPFQRMTSAGYNFTAAGENIAAQMTSGTVTNQMTVDLHQLLFVDSNVVGRGHRTNILNSAFQEIGVGQASGEYPAPAPSTAAATPPC